MIFCSHFILDILLVKTGMNKTWAVCTVKLHVVRYMFLCPLVHPTWRWKDAIQFHLLNSSWYPYRAWQICAGAFYKYNQASGMISRTLISFGELTFELSENLFISHRTLGLFAHFLLWKTQLHAMFLCQCVWWTLGPVNGLCLLQAITVT